MNRKYCFSKIPVIKGVYKTLFYSEYKVIMLFLPREICSTVHSLNIHQREVDHHQHRTVQSTASKS